MKKVIWIVLIIASIAGIAGILYSNKQKQQNKTSTNVIQKSFPVNVTNVTEEQLQDALSMVGTVAPNNDVTVTSETTGRIVKCNVQVGQYVHAGQVLFQVDDEMKAAQLKIAEANFEKAQKDSARIKYLVSEKSMAASQWDGIELQYKLAEQQLIQAQRLYNDTRIKSPISGVVTARYADVGAMVNNMQSGTPVCNIVDVSRLKIKLNVAERDVFKFSNGQNVQVTTDVYPGEKFNGSISNISQKADEAHTYPVEISIANNASHPFKAGMFARVEFTTVKARTSVVVPREAIVGSLRDASVFIVDGSKSKVRKIVVGSEHNGKVEVTSGLSAGERVVVNGQNNLIDGSDITIQ